MDLKESDILGDSAGDHWYYAAKARALLQCVAGIKATTLLDVGAGSGFFSRYLLDQTTARDAWCIDTEYTDEHDESVAGKELHFRRQCAALPADLVLLMDVLEHVDDDVGLLRSYAEKVPPGTAVFMSVPAFRWLWSGHDVFLGHRRRYTLSQLEAVTRAAGLDVVRGHYFFLNVLPLALVTRLVQRLLPPRPAASQLSRHSAPVNATLKLACRLEESYQSFNRLGGLSVFCLARTRAR